MNDSSTTLGAADRDFEQQLRDMNEALLVSSVHQHELTELARKAEAVLRESHDQLRSHTDELDRFNRFAVGREVRIIELKKEVNDLYQRSGETAHYPLAFEQETQSTEVATPTVLSSDGGLVPLESVLCTEELHRRPARPPDYETESRTLAALAQALADSPLTILQSLVDTILEAFQAGSAGISLLRSDEKRFYWPAIAGAWRPHIGGGTPRDFGPCGDVLDHNAPLLFRHVERRYEYFLPVTPPVEEALLVPFYVDGKAIGTVWAIAHDNRRKFDAEDLRQLERLGRFASAAYQVVESLGALKQRRDAAINLMEDAVQSRQAMEKLNLELQESETRAHALFEAAPMAVFVCDRNSTIQQYNTRAVELWGRAPVRGVEQHCGSAKLWLPDGTRLPHPQSPIVEVLRTGVPVRSVEVYIERPDGSRIPVLANFAPLENARGEITGAITSFIDITERKQMEASLRDSETRYRRMFESAHDGILILDAANGTIIDANPLMTELLGYSHDYFIGKELWEIGLFRDKSVSEAAVRELREKGDIHYEDLPLESDRGRRVEVEVVANVYAEGQQSVIQCNVRDITQRSRLELQTKEQAEALVDLHRRKDEFLAMLSHELRNPLAPITNAMHLLRLQKNEGELQQKARTIIERQVSQLTRLVDDLMEVSRITTGRVQLRQDQVVVSGIIERGVEAAQPMITQRRQELLVSLPPEPIWLNADAARLEQVVVNLLTNAAKYTDEGGRIWLTVRQEGDECVLRVRDTGVGIAPELLPRIFDLFTQAERSLDRSQGGLGIGLALVQRLVELHGGRVEAHSSLGQGSEFVVRLPMVLSARPLSPSSATKKAKPTGAILAGAGGG